MKKFLLSSFILIFIFLACVSAYDNLIIHPSLTEAAIKVFENNNDRKLSEDEKKWIIQGSIAEDTDPRYKNHYYDPLTGKGLDDYEYFAGGYWRFTGMPAKEWAFNQSSVSGDYSVGKTLENYRNGNKKRAYQGIGHILHLIQDMAVPAHTLNDSHAQGDPYESWAEKNGKINLSKAEFVPVYDIGSVFDQLGGFTSKNFFSIDRINLDKFKNYKTIEDNFLGIKKKYIVNNVDNIDYKIISYDDSGLLIIFDIDDFKVHMDYWNILHPKAIGYSAGVLDYFIKEFEKIDKEEKEKLGLWGSLKNSVNNLIGNTAYAFGDTFLATRNSATENFYSIKSEVISYQEFANLYKESLGEVIGNVSASGMQMAESYLKKDDEIKVLSDFMEFGESESKPAQEKIGVQYVIDGDTIILTNGQKVRYIGIDAPELNQAGPEDDECLAWVARLRNMQLLSSGELRLVKDPSADTDQYGRLLRYVYAGDVFLNSQLTKEGMARAFFCQPGWQNCPLTSDKERERLIIQSNKFAQDNYLGIYSEVCQTEKIPEKIIKKEYSNDVYEILPLPAYLDYIFLSNKENIIAEDKIEPEIEIIKTIISAFPPDISSSIEANFVFSSNFENAVFEYDLNNSGWLLSGSNLDLENLPEGLNKIAVRAKDGDLVDSSTTEFSWFIDISPPIPAISSISSDDGDLVLNWRGEDLPSGSGHLYFDLEYKYDNNDWQEWILKSSDFSGRFKIENNYFKICFRIKAFDQAGNMSGWEQKDDYCYYNADYARLKNIYLDSPNLLGNGYSASSTILLDFEAVGDISQAYFYVSESSFAPEIDDTNWLDYMPDEFLLSEGDGLKTVFAWIKTGDLIGEAVSSSIILDTEAPGEPQFSNIYFYNNRYFIGEPVFSLSGKKSPGDSIIILNDQEISLNPDEDIWTIDGVDLNFSCVINNSTERNECKNEYLKNNDDLEYENFYDRQVSFRMIDMAGNTSETYVLNFSLDFLPPFVASFRNFHSFPQSKIYLLGKALDSVDFSIRWSGINKYYFQYSQNKGEWLDFEPAEYILTDKTLMHRFEGEFGNEYDFRCRAVDNVGNFSAWTDNWVNAVLEKPYP
jgi:endonuclease YncB( thermonuclease family)